MGILIAYAGLATVLSLRSWTTVGAAGVSICWGIGRGRTYPWPEIRWIDIREITSRQGTFLAVRITLADGRRRTLPGLQHNPTYPHPTFHTDFHRVVNWWKLSTDPVARIQPPKRLRDRLNPTMVGVILSVLVCAVSVLIVALRG